jgi:hypothetical protein
MVAKEGVICELGDPLNLRSAGHDRLTEIDTRQSVGRRPAISTSNASITRPTAVSSRPKMAVMTEFPGQSLAIDAAGCSSRSRLGGLRH